MIRMFDGFTPGHDMIKRMGRKSEEKKEKEIEKLRKRGERENMGIKKHKMGKRKEGDIEKEITTNNIERE